MLVGVVYGGDGVFDGGVVGNCGDFGCIVGIGGVVGFL